MSYLRKVSQKLLREADEKPDEAPNPEQDKKPETPSTSPDVSLDAQVDDFLVKLEGSGGLEEAVDERRMTRQFFEAAMDPGGFDPHTFAMGVMRLINHFDTLIDFKDTIVRRAEKYLKDNKDPESAKQFMDELKESFGVEVGLSYASKEYEYEAPPAIRSGGTS